MKNCLVILREPVIGYNAVIGKHPSGLFGLPTMSVENVELNSATFLNLSGSLTHLNELHSKLVTTPSDSFSSIVISNKNILTIIVDESLEAILPDAPVE